MVYKTLAGAAGCFFSWLGLKPPHLSFGSVLRLLRLDGVPQVCAQEQCGKFSPGNHVDEWRRAADQCGYFLGAETVLLPGDRVGKNVVQGPKGKRAPWDIDKAAVAGKIENR